MSVHTETLQRFYTAINRNDIQAIDQYFDLDIVRNEFEGSPEAGVYRGIAQVQENIATGRGTWAEGSCDPEAFFEKGDTVVVYAHARVRVHGASEWTGGRFADGFVFRDGKIVEYHSFAQRADALKWAGIEV
jgi:uncharacterized protein